MPCTSRPNDTCLVIHSPVQMSAPSPIQNLYQTKSPAATPSPLPFTTLPQSKSPAGHGAFATQVCSPVQSNTSPAPLITSSSVPAQALGQPQVAPSVAAALNIGPGPAAVGASMVQFLSAPAANQTTASLRVSANAMKPIQPKQPQILPKPAGGTGQNQYSGSLNKQVTVNHRNMAVAPSQPNPIVIGQNQTTVLPNHNMTMSGQGTLLFNGISLGLAQNPILIQGGAGGLQNLQLLVRPQQSGTLTASSSQPNAQQGVNPAALLAAWQVQNQAAQQAMLAPAKGQTVVIPGTNIITSTSPQQTTLATNQTLHTRPNVIVNQRMVNGNQGALQIQQIQTAHGPIALAITPQQLRSIHGNITLANASTTSGAGTVGSVIQGVTIPQASQSQLQGTTLQAGVVLNSHSLAQSQSSSLTPVTVTLSQETVPMTEQPSSQPLTMTKPPGVNLEELLKQAGIVPSDPVPSLQQSQTTTTVMTNNILTTSPVVTMTQSRPVITQIQTTTQPTVVLSSAQVPISESSQSQLLTQLQPSVNLNQPQQSQGPLKLSINQVGSVFLQRPLVATSISQPTLTATTTATSTEVQSIPSMLLQRLNDVPQVSTALSEPAASLIPLTVQNINLSTPAQSPAILAVSSHSATTTTSVVYSSAAPTTSVSGLIQTHPTLVQSLGQTTSLGTTASILGTTVNQKVKAQNVVPQQNDSLANHQSITSSSQSLPARTLTATTTVTPTVISATIPTVTAIVKSEPSNLFLTNSPITTLSAGQKVQTIQLTPQNQENLQKVQTQLCFLLNQKNHTPQQRQQIQQLQATQQKILSQGKLIAIQQSPNQTIQLVQHPFQQQQIIANQSQKTPLVSPCIQATSIQSTTLTPSSSSSSLHSNSAQQAVSKQNVHLSNLLKQVPNQSASVRVVSTIAQSTPASAANATVTVPTQMKIGNQVITLTSQQRQTVQQLQQQLKTLTPEQQQIYLSQNKQAVILKLQQQQQPIVSTGPNSSSTSTVFTPSSATGASTIAVAANSSLAGGLLVIQTFSKGIAQVKSLVPTIVQEQSNRGVKRPAPTPLSQTALFQKQLASDEQGALHPDCKTPFHSVSDACKRLLKYHVFNSKTPKLKDLQKADDLFETASEQLLEKSHSVYAKYRYLLFKESMKEFPSAELVMLEKLFIEDEKEALKNDKKDVEEGKVLDLPPLPEHWIQKTIYTDLSTTTSVTTGGIATMQASSHVTTTTTTVHVAPLLSSSPVVIDKKEFHSGKTSSQTSVYFSNTSANEKSANIKDATVLSVVQKPKDEKTEKSSCEVSKVKKEEIKVEDNKNYDEWAEIQKELEMYPLESDHADNLEISTTPQVDFEPPEDSSTLADFEPPIMKTCTSTSSVNTYLGSMADDTGRLHTSAQTISNSNSIERMDTSTDWNMYNNGNEERGKDKNPLINESEAAVESILQPEESHLDLSDIEEFNRHYSSDHDVESTNPSIRCNGVKEEKELLIPSTLLMEGVDGEDIAIEQSLKSPDDDLNAQVESAINSILNLQRTDEAFEYETTESYQLEDMETKEEEQMNLDYVSPPLELDTCEVVDAALEEAVKSILM